MRRRLALGLFELSVLGTGEEIPALVEAHRIDTLLISSPEIPPARVAPLQEVLEGKGVEL